MMNEQRITNQTNKAKYPSYYTATVGKVQASVSQSFYSSITLFILELVTYQRRGGGGRSAPQPPGGTGAPG
jgi:hypothetical protein